MRLQDEGAAGFLARPVDTDDDRCLRMVCGKFRSAGMGGDRLPVHRESIHRIAARLEAAIHKILHGMFVPAQGRDPHQILGKGDLVVKAIGH